MSNIYGHNNKRMNPLFARPKKDNTVSKQLDEIAEKPKRTVRKDWNPQLAKDDVIVEVDNITPSLADGAEIIEVEDDSTDASVDVVTPQPSLAASPRKPAFKPLAADTALAVPNPVKDAPVSPRKLMSGNSGIHEEFGSRQGSAPVNPEPVTPRPQRVIPPVNSKRRENIFLGVDKTPATRERNITPTPTPVNPATPVSTPATQNNGGRVRDLRAKETQLTDAEEEKLYTDTVKKRTGLNPRKDEALHVDQRPTVLKAKSGVNVEDWNSDTTTDTDKGFGGDNDKSFVEPELGAGFHLTDRDITIIRFLARYRYAYNFQIARLVRTSVKGIRPRLRTLAERGFIRKQVVTGTQHIWLSTKAGNLVADSDLSPIKKGEISWVTVAHTLGLGNIGIELETGGENYLKEDEWPRWNNVDIRGRAMLGERVITEKEIRAGQQKWRMNRTTAEMREVTEEAINDPGDQEVNERTGEVEYSMPPEALEGNEGLFVIYAPSGEHIPDMVISRGRDENGKPINIAIELELHEKTHADWRRILKAYKEYGDMYDKVIYFTQKRNISNQLQKINNSEIFLPPEKFMIRKYIPKNEREPFWG